MNQQLEQYIDNIERYYDIDKEALLKVIQWINQYGEPFYHKLTGILHSIKIGAATGVKKLNPFSSVSKSECFIVVFRKEDIVLNNTKTTKCVFTHIDLNQKADLKRDCFSSF